MALNIDVPRHLRGVYYSFFALKELVALERRYLLCRLVVQPDAPGGQAPAEPNLFDEADYPPGLDWARGRMKSVILGSERN